MATTKITSPDLFNLESLDSALKLPSGTTAQRPTSPSTGEWRYNTTTNYVEFWDGGAWRDLQSEDIPPIPSENFNTVIWSGDDTDGREITVGFKPDFVWIKPRNLASSNRLFDSTRGATKFIISDSTSAEQTASTVLQSFTTTGFTVGVSSGVNESPYTYVAWCWKANGGTTSSNTDGTITSTVQANTKAGFSIVTWTGAGAVDTLGHGLSQQPELMFIKNTSRVVTGAVYSTTINSTGYLFAGTSGNEGFNPSRNDFMNNNTAPTSTVFTVRSYDGSGNDTQNYVGNFTGDTYVSYLFHSVAGYSKISTYIGNSVQDGPLVITGFEPAFVLVKNTSRLSHWRIVDNKRSPLNHRQRALFPDLNVAESNDPNDAVDFLSTGFKISNDNSMWNQNGDVFIYMAFASDPTAAPTLADSFSNVAYFGDGQSNRAITGLGFSPSWVWIKNRVAARDHMEFDNVRLLGSELVPGNYTNLDAADFNTTANDFNSFDTDGFTVGSDPYTNDAGSDMIAWTWKANPIPAINNDGDIQSIVSANQAAGFSIVTYTGTSTAGATIGHGLSAAPDAVIIKCMNTGSTNWINYYETIGVNDYLTLNLNNALDTFSNWFTSSATTFTFGAVFGNTNTSGRTYVAYCFKSTAGFSKMGSYSGTGSAGNAQNVGFTPAWVMIKRTNSISDWYMFDTARGDTSVLLANSSAAQFTNTNFNLTSTGFDFDGTDFNEAGSSWIYMAFKENPTPYPAAGNMSFLVIAGGGGGARYGGAGAGGYRNSYANEPSGGNSSSEADISLSAGTYTVTIGAGGTGGNRSAGSAGANSTLSTIIANGGGEGVRWPNNTAQSTQNGGSGGGQDSNNSGTNSPGTTVTTNDGKTQGTNGGPLGYGSGSTYYGSGGGGAGVAGGSATQGAGNPGAGGNGLSSSITGTSITRGGGGGGANGAQASPKGVAGTGGGGEGTAWNNGETPNGTDGTANTGGGGGAGMSGGSGVVILRLLTSEYSGTTTGSPTVTTDGDYSILTYTGSGTYVHS